MQMKMGCLGAADAAGARRAGFVAMLACASALGAVLLLGGCESRGERVAQRDARVERADAKARAPINQKCPVSGGAVEEDAPRVVHKGYLVALCCPGCADGWQAKSERERDEWVEERLPRAAEGSRPINTLCPVAEHELRDETVLLRYKGRVIGLCCDACLYDWASMSEARKDGFVAQAEGGR